MTHYFDGLDIKAMSYAESHIQFPKVKQVQPYFDVCNSAG